MVYLASPFFNMFECVVKGQMIEAVEKEFGLEDHDLFDPEDSDASREYGSESIATDRFKLAKKIYSDNVRGITECDFLVFPKYTTDLGTLWEVGYAMGIGRPVYRYNFLTKKLEKVEYRPILWSSLVNFDRKIETTVDAVIFGVLSSNGYFTKHLIYSFKEGAGLTDNIMFAANFKFKDSIGKVLEPEDRNWEGGIL